MTRHAVAVRPYGERLRPKVFAFLAAEQIDVAAPPEIGVAASNDDVVRYLLGHKADLLVVPFHVVRSAEGERTNGLELLAFLRQSLRWIRDVPVVMPVSLFVRVAFDVQWRANPLPRVFPLFEEDLELPETTVALRRFLEGGPVAVAHVPGHRVA